jgi:hypothetical protein
LLKAVPIARSNAQKILARLKGLAQQLQPDEEPIEAFPAIWDNGQSSSSALCDVIITNQRVIGFYARSFPRERLFFDSLSLSDIKNVILRQKSHEPMFHELMLSVEKRKVYIRAPRKKIADLYASLKTAIDHYGSTNHTFTPAEQTAEASNNSDQTSTVQQEQTQLQQQTIYAQQELQTPFETSLTAIALLFAGGIVLEIVGVILWSTTHDAQIGFPLCFAGFFAVAVSIWQRRKLR